MTEKNNQERTHTTNRITVDDYRPILRLMHRSLMERRSVTYGIVFTSVLVVTNVYNSPVTATAPISDV